MGQRIAIGGIQNTGKSFGRRYIPDGENVMLIQPSVKSSHLFIGPTGVEKFTTKEIDAAINNGTRKMVTEFDIVSPEAKYGSLKEALQLIPSGPGRTLATIVKNIYENKPFDYYTVAKGPGDKKLNPRDYLKGNIMLCDNLSDLKLYIDFVDKFMPWIHTIILPDFTHYVSEVLTSSEFINKKAGGDAFTKYLELASDGLRQFIKSSDTVRKELIIVTEYHVEFVEALDHYEIFTPGGKMLKEKLLPSSYYDVFLFTDVKYPENEEQLPEYRFVTRKVKRYPEARSIGNFPDLYMDNNLQEVLNRVRIYNNIPIQK